MNETMPDYRDVTEGCAADNVLKIYTLGRFQICFGDQLLFGKTGRFQKISELLMYLITNRGKYAPPEIILETIWPDHDYANPKNVFKNMIYRLKQGLEQMQVPEAKSYIVYSHGGYGWNINAPYWLDTDAFVSMCQEANSLLKLEPLRAADKYREALALYLGHYIPECQYCHWVLPRRYYYRRLFIRSATELFELEKEHRLFSQLVDDCEKILSIEDIDESIHLFYMEALAEDGKVAHALYHYEYITTLNYHASGDKPSPSMQRIYRAIKTHSEKAELDFNDLKQLLIEIDPNRGAFFCEPETFRLLCLLERRRAEQDNRPVQIGLLTLTGPGLRAGHSQQLQKAMECLRNVLLETIRRTDAISPWNESQFTVLFPGLNLEQAEDLLQKVLEAFKTACPADNVALQGKVHSFLPPATSTPES